MSRTVRIVPMLLALALFAGCGPERAAPPETNPAPAGIPLRIMTYVFEPHASGTTHVLVAAEFDGSHLGVEGKGKARTGRLELSVLATHRDTGREFRADDTLALTVAAGEAPAWRALAREARSLP